MSSASNTFLLRPVSRNSVSKSPGGGVVGSNPGGAGGGESADVLDVKSPAAKAAIAAAVAAAKGNGLAGPNDIHSLGPEFRPASYGHTSRGMLLRKQRTTESAPTSHLFMTAGPGGTLRHYPR